MALMIDLEPGVTLRIGEATVTLVAKSGRKARLEVTAAKNIPITVANGANRYHKSALEGQSK
jgi:hypothetical protein